MKYLQSSLIFTFVVLLIFVYIQSNFTRNSVDSSEVMASESTAKVLKILAPYESTTSSRMLQDLARQYSEIENNPEVEIKFVSKNDFQKKICKDLEQKDLADLIICDNSIMPALINLNVLEDISTYIEDNAKVPQYSQGQWNNTRNDGKYYGLPFTNDPYVLIWNKRLFKQNDVTVPINWEELRHAAAKASKVGVYGIGIGAKQPEEITALFIQLLYSTGVSIREINSEDGLKVFELINDLKMSKLMPIKCLNWTQQDLTYKFMNGEVAMMLNNLSALSVIKAGNIDFEVGISAVPYEKKENYMFHGKNIGVSITADHDASIKFLDFISQKELVMQIADAIESIPVQLDIPYNHVNDGYVVDQIFVQKQRESGIAKSSLNSWFDISTAISDGMYRMISETNPSIEDIANAMQDQVRIAIIDN